MNSSTLRRLAADQASLRTTELPPNFFFSSSEDQVPDDLTQLTILLAGPQSTPYSQGLWKVHLKMPHDYPKNPPKASFRTRIWHPNVEENSGSVCVDTLKKDWESKLTLRDVLVTISCLLIHPNPDSALNSTAGHLLQNDYDSFARQAQLMTSIHANTPAHLRSLAAEARCRGDTEDSVSHSAAASQPSSRPKAVSGSSVTMKKRAQRISSPPLAPVAQQVATPDIDSDEEEEDEATASKENNPALSPHPVPLSSPRKSNHPKRPLADLPSPTEEELNPSRQNIINNSLQQPAASDALNACLPSQLVETNQVSTPAGGSTACDSEINASNIGLNVDTIAAAMERPKKRICSDKAKEDLRNANSGLVAASTTEKTGKVASAAITSKKPLAPVSANAVPVKAAKARVGLRRL